MVTATYLRSLNIDELFGILRQDGVYFSIYDGLGSTLNITNQSGTSAVQYAYEPFGKTQSSNPAFANPFQFTGRENDGTELYFYRQRQYSPTFHRFLSEDPLELAGSDINFYAYARNSPLVFIDPTGLLTLRSGISIPPECLPPLDKQEKFSRDSAESSFAHWIFSPQEVP